MIHSKNRNGFALIEAMIAVVIASMILVPLFMLQSTAIQRIFRLSAKVHRFFLAKHFLHTIDRKTIPGQQPTVLETKINTPPTFLKYEIVPVQKESELARIGNIFLERIIISWDDHQKKNTEYLVRFTYKPKNSGQ